MGIAAVACALVFVAVPVHASGGWSHISGARTGKRYLTWRGDVDDLTRVNNTFFLPAEELLDGVKEMPPNMKAECVKENDVFKCFCESDFGDMVHWSADPRRSGSDGYFRV